jgi:hypothetical protein
VNRYWRTMLPEAVQGLQARHATTAAKQAA